MTDRISGSAFKQMVLFGCRLIDPIKGAAKPPPLLGVFVRLCACGASWADEGIGPYIPSFVGGDAYIAPRRKGSCPFGHLR